MLEPAPPRPASADAPSETTATERPKVIFVMGSGHSGSTILSVTLGNCTGWFYAGELQNFLTNGGTPTLGGVARSRFWGVVRDAVPDAEALFGNDSQRLIERSMSLLRVGSWARRRRLRPRYRRIAQQLFEAIADSAGVTYVIDSSHFPLRARELQSVSGIELYLIFLVRDPQRVIPSINRLINRNDALERIIAVFRRNVDLWLTHLLSVWVFTRQPSERRIFVRYEDFLAAPEEVVRQILRCAQSPAEVPDLQNLSTGLPLHANRLVRAETVALREESDADRPHSRVTELLQRPWAPVLARMSPAAERSRETRREAHGT